MARGVVGNIQGLARHLSKKYGGDPHFFTKCTESEELARYSPDQKNRICAEAHKIATGIYPGEHTRKKHMRVVVRRCCAKYQQVKESTMPTITIDTEEDDDWMKSLPGYRDEAEVLENARKIIQG